MSSKPVILLVDDVAANIQVLAAALKADYHIKVATDGERCLILANTSPKPDMILLDINMPGMGGHEVCSHLKNDPNTKTIPVIFVTAMNADEDEEYGLELGAVDYITKPIKPAIVKARVKTHVTLKQQNDKLAEMALQDQLTGLYNRHYLVDRAKHKMASAMRYQQPLTILMLDIDFFKNINDQHGHLIGDLVLQAIADILNQYCRAEDVVARFGGEEFVMLIDNCNGSDAVEKANKLRLAIEASQPNNLTVTTSIGCAEFTFGSESFEELLKQSDEALYQAKEQGRNQVVLYKKSSELSK